MTPAHRPADDLPALPPAGGALDRFGGGDPTVLVPVEDPPALSTRLTPLALLRALGRCWMLAVPVGLVLGVAAAAAMWTLRPDKYTSAALIQVLPASAGRLLEDRDRRPDGGPAYMQTQLALLRSRPVLKAALTTDEKVRQLPLLLRQPDPYEFLERELDVKQIGGTGLVRVAMTARGDWEGLDRIVNAVVDSHLKLVEATENKDQQTHLSELQKAYKQKEDDIRKLHGRIREQSRSLNGSEPQVLIAQRTTLLSEHAATKGELAKVEARLRDLELRLAGLKRRLAPPADPAAPPAADPGLVDLLVERELDADPQLRAFQADVDRAKEAADVLAKRATDPGNKMLASARERLAEATKKLDETRAVRRAAVAKRHAAADRATAAAAALETEADMKLLEAQRKKLADDARKAKDEVDRLGIGSTDLDLLRQEAERSEAFVRLMWEQKERLEIELNGGKRDRVKVLSKAEAATISKPLGRAMEAAGVGLAGFLFGLAAVAFREARRGRIHHTADVARGLRLPVVGSLPAATAGSLAEALQQAGGAAGRYNRGLVESVDALRTRLLRGRAGGRCPVLMVASPAAGEGKTTLAGQLAASLARAGYATLLVDGDLRRPTLHQLFRVAPAPGLCDLLAGEYGADAVVRPTAVDNLHLLPAGVLTPRASAGLAQAVVPALFDGLRARYDFVVLDSSPLLLVSDAFLLGRSADGVLVSVRPGVSQAADVYAAYQQLVDHHLPFTGVVVNGVPGRVRYAEAYGSHELAAPADPVAPAADPA